jgi:transcriptional regulator with XRE-family HTH domain
MVGRLTALYMNTTLTSVGGNAAVTDALLLAMARERVKGRAAHRIAAAMGIHPSLLSLWLHGRRQPSLEQAERLAEVLGVPMGELFPEVGRQNRDAPARKAEATRETSTGLDPRHPNSSAGMGRHETV